jgi:hypothetical protein
MVGEELVRSHRGGAWPGSSPGSCRRGASHVCMRECVAGAFADTGGDTPSIVW